MDFPTEIPSVDPADAASLHPLEYLQQIAQQAHAPIPSVPSVPNAPAAPGGDDGGWRTLLKMFAPVVGGLAMGGGPHQTGFLQGWQEGQQIAQQEKDRKAQEAQKRSVIAAKYLQDVSDKADQITDPAQWTHFVDVADMTSAKAGFTEPGEVKNQLAFPRNKLAAKQLKDLSDQLSGLEKNYNLDELAQTGATIALSDGTHVPIATAMDVLRVRPLGAGGQPVPRPAKAAGTEEERYIAKWAKENGKKVDDLTSAEELQARKLFREAGRADKTPPSPASVDSQFNDLVELWKVGHPGQEPPADVRTKLRVQAKKEIGQADDRPRIDLNVGGTGAGALDPDGIDYAATEYRVTGRMPALGMGNGAARAAIINNAAKQAKVLGQSAAAAIQKQYAYKSDATALTKMRTMSSAAESFESKALAQADIIEQLSAKVPRSQWPIINDAIIGGKIKLLGDSSAQQLANAVETFSAEYAKIIEGSTGSAAGSSDSSRRAAGRLINPSFNKGTMADVLNLMRREMRLTVQGYDATIDHITTRMGGRVPDAPIVDTPAAGGDTSSALAILEARRKKQGVK